MRSSTAYLLAGVTVGVAVAQPSVAERAAVTAPAGAAAPTSEIGGSEHLARLRATWDGALDRLDRALGAAGRLEVPPLLARVGAYFDVRLRSLAHRGERLVIDAGQAVGRDVPVPDLSPLSADPVKGIESSGFGWRADPIHGGRKFHKGTDYRADRGTPVFAAGPGVVTFQGRQDGYGKVIYIDHGAGLITRYAHLRKIGVARGDAVVADDLIGEVGSTGRTTGPHLHFEIRIDGRAVDPVLAMHVAELQRTEPPEAVRVAAMALLPEVQRRSVDRHDPENRRRNRPERRGRTASRRERPST
jgi:murein DD-endopeptidase MepM/ murein hydrolase activator NlpD